jgi:TolA-binding protein
MPTVPPPSRDVALETRFFLERFKKEIISVLIVALLAAIGFIGYRYYVDRRAAAASASLASAKTAQEYQQVIDRYPNSAAAGDAHLLLAEALRSGKKFAEANTTLQAFIDKFPQNEFVSTARMAMAANLESMGKSDEALAAYQQVATTYPNSYNAPLALLSQVFILKEKNRSDEARQTCEKILTQYRTSFWAGEAMQELRLLKPSSTPVPAGTPAAPVLSASSGSAASSASTESIAGCAITKAVAVGRDRRARRGRTTERTARRSLPTLASRRWLFCAARSHGFVINVSRIGNVSARRVDRTFCAPSSADPYGANPQFLAYFANCHRPAAKHVRSQAARRRPVPLCLRQWR